MTDWRERFEERVTTPAHPDCHTERGHVCALPSGHQCAEKGCKADAGTLWGPYWCPPHDEVRLNRVSESLSKLLDGFGVAE